MDGVWIGGGGRVSEENEDDPASEVFADKHAGLVAPLSANERGGRLADADGGAASPLATCMTLKFSQRDYDTA